MNSVAAENNHRERQNSINFEHKKLCRVSRGPKIQMGTTPPSLVADLTNKCSISPDDRQQQQQQLFINNSPNNINFYSNHRTRQRLETVDSDPCYSSDGEHSNLSRNESTNSDCLVNISSADADADAAFEVVVGDLDDENSSSEYSKILVTPHDSGYSDSTNESSSTPPTNSNEYAALLEYTLKLGYSELQLRTVLQRLNSSSSQTNTTSQIIGQNNLLAELIKLGQTVQENSSCGGGSGGGGGGSGCCDGNNQVGSTANDCSSTQQNNLRAVVIDGSNVAIT